MSEKAQPRRVTLSKPARVEALAALRPDTVDEADRSVDVAFYTGATVIRYDWGTGETFDLVFEMSADAADFSDLNTGAPVLANHSPYDQRGVVVDGTARIEDGECRARLRYSRNPRGEELWQDVKDKIARRLSMGVDILEVLISDTDDDGAPRARPLHTALRWRPFEISHAALVADTGTHTLSAARPDGPGQTQPLQKTEEETMSTQTAPAGAEDPRPAGTTETDPKVIELAQKRAEELVKAELARQSDINAAALQFARLGELPEGLAKRGIDEKWTVDRFTREALAAITKRDEATPSVSGVHGAELVADHADKFAEAAENALLHRAFPDKYKLAENNDLGGFTFLELGRAYKARHALRSMTNDKRELADLVIAHRLEGGATRKVALLGGMHTTSDWSNIFANVQTKVALDFYQAGVPDYRPWCRRSDLPDFKQAKIVAPGLPAGLPLVPEGAEYKQITFGDTGESYVLSTYGGILTISRQAIINDDKQILTGAPQAVGQGASQTEGDVVFAILVNNGNLSDGVALFASAAWPTGHANSTTGAASPTTYGAMTALMRKQVSIEGAKLSNLIPRHIVAPVASQNLIEQQYTLVGYMPNAATGVLTKSQQAMQMHFDPRLDDDSPATGFYLVADPSVRPLIVYGFLEGGPEGPFLERTTNEKTRGVSVLVSHDFAAGAADPRAGVYSTGA